ncbi:MAG TPA: hypothetical protein VEQ60_22370, partial [Longimicrobium sp.]|nr:hypothetical protein [Longimicrobium sp.]
MGSLDTPPEPFGEFNEEETEMAPAVADAEPLDVGPAAPPGAPEGVPQAEQAAAGAATRTVIRGPREMWNFNGATPPNYDTSARLTTNRRGGTFAWSTSANLALSSATDPTPTVSTVLPSVPPGRDAWIRVRHTSAAGVRSAASYRLNILAPDSLTHLRDVDNPDPGFGYSCEIHYSIHDQFGTMLPRNVPLNELFTGATVTDLPGSNWPRPPQCGTAGICGASFNPADWFDNVTGVGVTNAIPVPVAPTHPDAAVAVQHWPGDWFVGGSPSGTGRRVRSVTWQRNRG